MFFSIISLALFLALAIASSFQGYSILIYGSMVPALFGFLFFLISVRAMGQRDLFEVFGSLVHKAKSPAPKLKASKSPKPLEKGLRQIQRPTVRPKTISEQPSPQPRLEQQLPPPPPPPPVLEQDSSRTNFSGETKCPRCGQKLHQNAVFCGRCGLKVRGPDAAPP